MVAQITIPAANVEDLLDLGFTRIEIWRSTDLGNLYSEITAASAQAAVLDSAVASTTYRMGGKLLKLKVSGGSERSISFSSVLDYWTPAQVVARINEVVASLASVVAGAVRLTAPTTGRASSILITYNDAADLGLAAGTLALGLAARPSLVSGTFVYVFSDVAGGSTDRYKWRFSANGADPVSEFSLRVLGELPPVSSDLLSIATATFLGIDGRPQRRTAVFASQGSPQSIAGYFAGSAVPLTAMADEQGFLQVPLLRGARIRVGIEGTAFVRELTVPDDDTFDLLTAMAAAPDPFTVQEPLPFLIRSSLT